MDDPLRTYFRQMARDAAELAGRASTHGPGWGLYRGVSRARYSEWDLPGVGFVSCGIAGNQCQSVHDIARRTLARAEPLDLAR